MYKIKFHKLGSSFKHYGTKGQVHGVRNYQNPDGSLTELGRIHYGVGKREDQTREDYYNQRKANRKEMADAKDKYKSLSKEDQKAMKNDANQMVKQMTKNFLQDYRKLDFKTKMKMTTDAQFGGGELWDDLQSSFFKDAMKETGGNKSLSYLTAHKARTSMDPYYYTKAIQRRGWRDAARLRNEY